jgi:hypothetical protein
MISAVRNSSSYLYYQSKCPPYALFKSYGLLSTKRLDISEAGPRRGMRAKTGDEFTEFCPESEVFDALKTCSRSCVDFVRH